MAMLKIPISQREFIFKNFNEKNKSMLRIFRCFEPKRFKNIGRIELHCSYKKKVLCITHITFIQIYNEIIFNVFGHAGALSTLKGGNFAGQNFRRGKIFPDTCRLARVTKRENVLIKKKNYAGADGFETQFIISFESRARVF